MGRELATQEIGNLATGQSLTNIDIADIGFSTLPGGNVLTPLAQVCDLRHEMGSRVYYSANAGISNDEHKI